MSTLAKPGKSTSCRAFVNKGPRSFACALAGTDSRVARMARGRGVLGFGLAVGVLFFGARSHAQEAAPPAKNVEFSAGLMGLVGGNYFTTPDNIPPVLGDGLGFAGDGGGFGWGVAAYGEGRFVRHLGVTLTLGYDRSMIQREVTYNDVVTVDEKLSIGSPRLGLMAKGILPTPFGRLWL